MVRGILTALTFMSFVSASDFFDRPDFPVVINEYGKEYVKEEPVPVYGYAVFYGRFPSVDGALEIAGKVSGAKIVRYQDIYYVVSPVFFTREDAVDWSIKMGGGEVRKVKVELEVSE